MERARQTKLDALHYRSASVVMDVNRLGTLYPYPLSFMRSLTRRILREDWEIVRDASALCAEGFGHVIYHIRTQRGVFSYVAFAKRLDADKRSDRVIAQDWDMTATLCEGEIDSDRLNNFRANVPLQENGRLDASCIVLSRANRSVRNFNAVVEHLSRGEQPDIEAMAKVGYLYRTTAVYGSGKFGMADWAKVRTHYPDFAKPFSAEMLSCYLIRDFSLFQADHVAANRAPETAVSMDERIKRYVGIGNATGLGMAPFLINHPMLINNWIEVRETALAHVKRDAVPTDAARGDFNCLALKAVQHLHEIATDNADQNAINLRAREEMEHLRLWILQQSELTSWSTVTDYAEATCGPETQELLHAVLMEVHSDLIGDLETKLDIDERYNLVPEMPASELKSLIETHYDWALSVDFNKPDRTATFWYRSEEKQEPRLGLRASESGAEKELLLGIARAVRECYDDLMGVESELSTARFAFTFPQHRYIIRRMQTMSRTRYGEIRVNTLDANVLPIHLLRCKLSFFGVGKFDPRSRFWVRNTMFQGAPLISDIGKTTSDSWCFPIKPTVN